MRVNSLDEQTLLNTSVMSVNSSDETVEDLGTAVILNAFPAFETGTENIRFRTDFYVSLESEWDNKGLQTVLDTDVTIEDFRSLNEYDVVCISTHGSTYEWKSGFLWLNHNRYPAICLAERSTKAKDKQYSVEIKDKQIVKVNSRYWILPSFIEHAYSSSELNDTFVFSETCEFKGRDGNVDNSMSTAFESRSAETVVGFHNSVLASYSRDFMKSYVDDLLTGATTQTSFNNAISSHGANHRIWWENQSFDEPYDTTMLVAYPILSGSGSATLIQTGIRNGDFESIANMLFSGSPVSWKCDGDVRSITQLGEVKPQGFPNFRMAVLTTGIGAKSTATIGVGTEGSKMSQKFIVPNDVTTLSFDYNFISEEPMEYVGTKYNDSFGIQLHRGNSVVVEKIYESINTSNWIEVSGINFAGGDDTVFQTGWKSVTVDVSAYRGKIVTLSFIVYDVGDSIYDSACVIDNVVLK